MSGYLLTQTLAYLATHLKKPEVKELRAYGGEFNSAEAKATGYTCPAVLVTVLGWAPEVDSDRLVGKNVRGVRMAAFVAFKAGEGEKRLLGAMNLAERVATLLRMWVPEGGDVPYVLAPLEEEPRCENMYSRAMDLQGQGLWMVTWDQCIKAQASLPQLWDLLAIEINDLTRQGQVPVDAPASGAITVTEEVNFNGPITPPV